MSNEKISELPPGAPAQAADALPIARGGANYQLAVSDIAAYVGTNAGGVGLGITGGNTSGTIGIVSTGTVLLAGGNNITLSQNGPQITIIGAAGGGTGGVNVSAAGNITGTVSVISSGTAVFAGGSNITLSQSGNAISIIGAAAGTGGQTSGGISLVGTNTVGLTSGSYAQSNLTMSGAGLVSLGFFNGSLVVSGPGTTGLSQSIYATGNTISSSSGTNNIGSLVFSGAGNVSVGVTNGSVLISGSGGGGGAGGVGFGVSTGGNTSGNTGTFTSGTVALAGIGAITMSQATGTGGATISVSAPAVSSLSGTGNASIALIGSTISIGANAAAVSVGGNSTSGGSGYSNISTGTALFAGGNNITLSQNGSVISIIGAAGAAGNVYLSAGGNTTGTLGLISTGTALFAGGANITLSQSGNTISIVGGAGGGLNSATVYGAGNTTNSSSATLALSSLVFNAYGAQSVGFSNGSVQLSAPPVSSIIGTGLVSVSVTGSTISIGVPGAYLTRSIYPQAQLAAISAPSNASLSVQYIPIDSPVTGSRIDALVGLSASSAAASNTAAFAFSVYMGISTRNGTALSSLSSGSTQTTYSYASNTAGNTQLTASAIRAISCPINFNLVPGEYFVGVNIITATSSVGAATTSLGMTMSMYGGTNIATALPYADITANTATSSNLYYGQGMFTAATTGMPVSIGLSNIAQTGASQAQANIGLVFRNG
jgi:hypothetical protein